ncbi:hypothetical protein EBR96_07720 [bacterium]|nr:hypothetical protein [bacterium]
MAKLAIIIPNAAMAVSESGVPVSLAVVGAGSSRNGAGGAVGMAVGTGGGVCNLTVSMLGAGSGLGAGSVATGTVSVLTGSGLGLDTGFEGKACVGVISDTGVGTDPVPGDTGSSEKIGTPTARIRIAKTVFFMDFFLLQTRW